MFSNLGSASITAMMRAYQPPAPEPPPSHSAQPEPAEPPPPQESKPVKAD